ncbi:unnamed protein product [Thlaspi arvense]|uniref:Cysteine/Histidine-rich C1 domain family protein n=1 Tax=Thlaspi arvense TaxID=13288 RepID=A0AAU9SHU5_THLAR|nr:unnamed protein product [Thlaspi arvense]
MDSEKVFRPYFHFYFMKTCNSLRKGDCCGHFKSTSDGYLSDGNFFYHKKCGDSPESIQHPSHSLHTLKLRHKPWTEDKLLVPNKCDICGKNIVSVHYRCETCDFDMDLYCAMYPPPDVINSSETHQHKLTLLKEKTEFVCAAKCGKTNVEFPYKCHECDSAFHIDCVWNPLNHPSEVNHSYHSLHPLKLFRGLVPDYSDGKCRLCGREVIDAGLFYHCSSCNFTLDWRCALEPPPQSLLDLKAHDHQLTLLPRLFSFTCNACGLKGYRSPYMCVQCDFMIHQDCLGFPRIININRHDHRVSRVSLLGVVKSVCGVCRRKVDWTCGGFSCHKCPGYVVHSKCATRNDVWNGKELEGVPEEEEDIEPYVVIDDNTIHHFSHKEHYLRLHHANGILYEENKRCNACIHLIGLKSFYGCIDCDFTLHKSCAEFPKKRWHVLHNERLTLVTSKIGFFWCDACHRISNGIRYMHGDKKFDVMCSSVSEPFVHQSHPDHPLYYVPTNEDIVCINGCNRSGVAKVLRCIEDDCEFVLCFECATLPQVVKHRIDNHPLTLCYGEEASGKYWCDICEKETNPKTWFYTCKDNRASLHTECVLGDTTWLMPGSTLKYFEISFEVVLNKSVSRPLCRGCKSHCMYAIILKVPRTTGTYFCSVNCMFGSCGSSNSSFSRSGAGRTDRYISKMK